MHTSAAHNYHRRPRITPRRRRFGADYEQLIRLRDGRSARILALRPAHAPLLASGFERLSPKSRYYRFLVPKAELTPEELRYFTRFDGEHHYALAALVETKTGWDGAGTARVVQQRDNASQVELAVTVLDEYQGCGLGTALAERILDAGAERGYLEATAEVLTENRAMLRLLSRVAPGIRRVSWQQGVVRLSMPLTHRRWFHRLRGPRPRYVA